MTVTNKRLLTAWLVLVVITLVYLWIDRSAADDGILVASTTVTISAIVLALVKFRVISSEFMEVRHAPRVLRRVIDGLIIVIAAALLGTYLIGRAVA